MDDLKKIEEFNKEEFIHKLNSYLSSIYGYIQMLEKKSNGNDDTKPLIESAKKECEKLIDYIEKANN